MEERMLNVGYSWDGQILYTIQTLCDEVTQSSYFCVDIDYSAAACWS